MSNQVLNRLLCYMDSATPKRILKMTRHEQAYFLNILAHFLPNCCLTPATVLYCVDTGTFGF